MPGNHKKEPVGVGDEPEAWSRFERAVDAAVKSGPKRNPAPQPVNKKARPASKGRVHKGKKDG
ncbi:hypothetical protein SS37A_32140 [Methylocystis iwaonis]|uniref:Uncharacterized protein n=1 Tax=Methylocystis iwaonis TaxID=2885079 RepID=A0ABN6VJ42_9HYPH|nr:hypothetical protein SS37A_32140 [Methylocystis iwaonis]